MLNVLIGLNEFMVLLQFLALESVVTVAGLTSCLASMVMFGAPLLSIVSLCYPAHLAWPWDWRPR
jgi:hypothetical protein